MHNSNIENSRPYAVGVVAIAVVWPFYKTGEEKTSPPITQQQVQLEVSPHIML